MVWGRLPGLDLTAKQLFFVSFATVWCEARRPASAHQQLLTDPHSPGRYRTIGTLQNSPDFAREFGCAAVRFLTETVDDFRRFVDEIWRF